MKDIINSTDYSQFLDDIKLAIQSRHTKAVYAVNREHITLYQAIGAMIIKSKDSLDGESQS